MVNKSDLLNTDSRQRLTTLLQKEFPGARLSFISSKTGDGVDRWLTDVTSEKESGRHLLDIDYDTYAEGEAVLGWLNARFGLNAQEDPDWVAFSQRYLEAIHGHLQSAGAQIGHIKLFLCAGDGTLTANLTAIDGPILVQTDDRPLRGKQADMTFNARAQIDPGELERISVEVFQEHFPRISMHTHGIRSLRPGRPQPTYRYAKRI